MTKTILCFSRSYLSAFLPHLMDQGDRLSPIYMVQSDSEQKEIEARGGRVVVNLQAIVRAAFSKAATDRPKWSEPDDMRRLTDYNWSPLYSDRHLPEYDEPTRLTIAGAIQEALEEVFDQYDVAGVLSEPVALFPTHYLLYLCKKYGAVPLLWANTYFPGYFFFTSDVHLENPVRRGALEEAQQDELRSVISQYLERVSQDKAGPVYHHKFAKNSNGINSYFKQRRGEEALVMSPKFSSRILQRLRLTRVKLKRLRFPRGSDYMTAATVSEHSFYMRNHKARLSLYDDPPTEFSKSNVFFPLQYEPEASLLYAAPDFRNQVPFVESMLQSLPAEHILWVKEHPNQFGALGHGQWKVLRKRYNNLRLIFGRENGRHLIQRCGLAVVITSTAGMDALVYGRTTLVLGDVFFRNYPGAKPLRSQAELSAALNDPDNYSNDLDPDFDLSGLVNALCQFGSHCYPGDPQPDANLYDKENVTALYKAITHEVDA